MDAFLNKLPTGRLGSEGRLFSIPGPSNERPTKRQRTDEILDSQSDDSEEFAPDGGKCIISAHHMVERDVEKSNVQASRVTDVENVLPPTPYDETALEEYEAFKSSQPSHAVKEESSKNATSIPRWKSSIYVDAFNLALDTVLNEESGLFNEKEMEVFKQWKDLPYEAQYTYVRLFLRKTDSWHRCSRLGYYADVSDPDKAFHILQQLRYLPDPLMQHDSISGSEFQDPGFDVTFAFADKSEEKLNSVEEAATLLYLDELKSLAKDSKVPGRHKAELIRNLSKMSQQQTGLMTMGLSRQNSRDSGASSSSDSSGAKGQAKLKKEDSNRESHFLSRVLSILGPCIRLSSQTYRLFERVHLVFYRSTEWTERSLTTIILAKISRRNFPEYVVCRTATIFASRAHLLEFEAAIKMEAKVDRILEFNGPITEEGCQTIIETFDRAYPRWKSLVEEEADKERKMYEMGEGAYLRRFNPAHSYTRLIHKALFVFARRKEFAKEHTLLGELLRQKLFHLARRGAWYQRKALLEEHYMPGHDPKPRFSDMELQKKHWKRIAVSTCEEGLQDPDCHIIFHYDLQKRLIKLERKLRVPRRLQHDFGHVRLEDPVEITVEGIQLKRNVVPKPGRGMASTKTIWLDELDTGGECSVEEMCLSHFRKNGWKGYHSEGGIVRTLFAYLFFDILFLYIPNVFQTAYQTCPLDLHTDAFFPVRATEINHRLVEIANGQGEELLCEVWKRESERRTSVVGLNWDFDIADLTELIRCFDGSALAAVCKVMAQEYKQRGGGMPDLVLWRLAGAGAEKENTDDSGDTRGEVMFAEVKSANDRLSDTQRLWIHVLTGSGIKVALCNAVAKEVRQID